MENVTELTARLAEPVIAEQGCTLWDVEYVKEAGTWYLRVLIDKEGGVDILDCEAISRKLSDLLDEADPIEGSYTLEVGSAGAERALKRPADFPSDLLSSGWPAGHNFKTGNRLQGTFHTPGHPCRQYQGRGCGRLRNRLSILCQGRWK